jgi:hypothetical protein
VHSLKAEVNEVIFHDWLSFKLRAKISTISRRLISGCKPNVSARLVENLAGQLFVVSP